MANYVVTPYKSFAEFQAAVQALATTVTIQTLAFKEDGRQKFAVIKPGA